MAVPTSRLRTPVLLQTVFTKTRVQSMNERSKKSRLTTTNVGDRPSLSEKNTAMWRSDASTRAIPLSTTAHSPISSKFQGIMSRDPLGEREDLDGPGGDANACAPEACNSIDSMRSERAASWVWMISIARSSAIREDGRWGKPDAERACGLVDVGRRYVE